MYLNGKNVLEPKTLEIISELIDVDEGNYRLLQKNNLSSYRNITHVYSKVFPDIYCSTEKGGFDLKSNFDIIFKTCKDKNQLDSSMGKTQLILNL